MKEKPLISIAIPIYNSERFLRKCLDSVISQTYENIEIIALNNSSTDSSLKIIQEYEKKDHRIKHFIIPHVPTESWSRNNAFVRATGDWIVPLDSDDYLEKEYVEKLWMRHLETNADWVGATMAVVNLNGALCQQIPAPDFDYSQVIVGKDAVVLTIDGWRINGNGALIRRELIPCIETGQTQPLYNVEYDTRVILYKARTVAFVDAKYYFGYNPNSVSRIPSFTKETYILKSYTGLLPFILQHYDTSSEEVKSMTNISSIIISMSYKNYLELKKLAITNEERNEYKEMIKCLHKNTLFCNLNGGFRRKIRRWVRMQLNLILLSFVN